MVGLKTSDLINFLIVKNIAVSFEFIRFLGKFLMKRIDSELNFNEIYLLNQDINNYFLF